MSSDIRDLVAVLARLGARAAAHRERAGAPLHDGGPRHLGRGAADRAAGPALPGRSGICSSGLVSLLWPPEVDGGSYLTMECLADLLGDQVLMTPLKAERHKPDEVVFLGRLRPAAAAGARSGCSIGQHALLNGPRVALTVGEMSSRPTWTLLRLREYGAAGPGGGGAGTIGRGGGGRRCAARDRGRRAAVRRWASGTVDRRPRRGRAVPGEPAVVGVPGRPTHRQVHRRIAADWRIAGGLRRIAGDSPRADRHDHYL